jgi:aspartyl-tRNA(Asn)/glutamyl-tRNA(Gln) amidotransferase subunit A
MIDIKNLTIQKVHDDLSRGVYTVRDLVDAYIEKIKKDDPEVHAYLEVFNDIYEQARHAQTLFATKKATLLTGIPIAVKDNILIQGKHVSAASKILEGYKAVYDATVIKYLKEQGAVLLGRTNMDEFAMGSSTQTSAYGITRNPHDKNRVPGGSSGGSAAAVAGDMALVALGTETCGSVRQPASFCGLVGLKPTYGALSRYGIIAMGNSLDQVSPFSKTVAESEIIFRALSRFDPNDATSVPEENRIGTKHSVKKIGVPRSFLTGGGLDSATLENFEKSLAKLASAGYEIVDIDIPLLKYSLAAYYVIMPAEVSTNLSRFDGIRYGYHAEGKNLMDVYTKSRGEGFGKEARRRILLGTYGIRQGAAVEYLVNLKPVLEMTSLVSGIKDIHLGDCVGYGCTFIADRDMTIATIPVGYFEGVDRRLSNKGSILINEKIASVVGRVNMNIITVDISGINVKRDDKVVVISRNPEDRNSIANMARTSEASPYEIAVHIPAHLKRVLIG